mmetsp:Transcript_6004/g.12951  ORF Transcript_6004/g.12951 Transcript_6004/m.12951 type:complete len:166 (+) Transcript_6004:146-643(+)
MSSSACTEINNNNSSNGGRANEATNRVNKGLQFSEGSLPLVTASNLKVKCANQCISLPLASPSLCCVLQTRETCTSPRSTRSEGSPADTSSMEDNFVVHVEARDPQTQSSRLQVDCSWLLSMSCTELSEGFPGIRLFGVSVGVVVVDSGFSSSPLAVDMASFRKM